MKLSDVYLYFGGKWTNIAKSTGISRAAVSLWVKQGYIPYSSQLKIQAVTGDELQASIDDDFKARVKSKVIDKKAERILKDAVSRIG